MFRILKGLKNFNRHRELESSSLPWFNEQDFSAFLKRCYHNSIPVYGVDIYLIRAGHLWFIKTLLPGQSHHGSGSSPYQRWNKSLLESELEKQLPHIRRKAHTLPREQVNPYNMFPAHPVRALPVKFKGEILLFVPALDGKR